MEKVELYGAHYFEPGSKAVYVPERGKSLYYYEAHFGGQSIEVGASDTLWVLDPSNWVARIVSGPARVESEAFAVVVRGYMAEERTRHIQRMAMLPYVNGCSTKQIFPPDRLGDPTLQYLHIPPYSAEQAHHIHSTARVVHILEGRGISNVGMEGKSFDTELLPGMNLVLDPMCPHHFSTPQGEALVCVPFHVFSSPGGAEFNHPMFNGTHLMNQGG